MQLWGAAGGWDNGVGGPNRPGGPAGEGLPGGCGGYVAAEMYIKAHQSIYVYVGCEGRSNVSGKGAGYNGGGNPGLSGWSGSGGGASDIRSVSGDWNENLWSRILVAAGGGGAGHSPGGYGGGLVGGSSANANSYQGLQRGIAGATQNSPGIRGGFGYGGTNISDGGGGGGGWYGGGAGDKDVGGSGGSSYIGGTTSNPVMNARTIAGNSWMPNTSLAGTMLGNSGPCYVYIHLMSTD